MRTRIITGVIALALWLALLFAGYYTPFWLAMTVVGLIISHEFFSMVLADQEKRLLPLVVPLAALPLFAIYHPSPEYLAAGLFLAALAGFLLTLFTYKSLPAPFTFLTQYIFGVLYCGFLVGHIILLMGLPDGGSWLIVLTAITAASDSGAYFVGRWLGKTKLCPHISPGKTVAGFNGGIICGTLGGVLLAALLLPEISLVKIALYGALLSVLGVAGDLTESIIKRATGTKDSGKLLPGHGGFLDRSDSLLFCAPTFYYILKFNLL
ncbi:MAG: phosphatidate cytidylyltransferase [Desulfurivibrionaceae bacterium]|nr:phosphatidate cytidylyltransferase [Desulfurivibrionaceae bacterium]